jgi:sigma-E factor negative regulatory protein RseA
MMSDRLGESLSALMDDEVSEIELHRILKGSEQNELRQTWFRYHTSRAVLRNEHNGLPGIDLSAGVLAHLEDEPEHSPGLLSRFWVKPLASSAIAASVAAVVFFGVQAIQPDAGLVTGVAGNEVAAVEQSTLSRLPAPIDLQVGRNHSVTVGYGNSAIGAAVAPDNRMTVSRQQNLDGRFNHYMLLHAEHAALNTSQGMMPFARVASFDVE